MSITLQELIPIISQKTGEGKIAWSDGGGRAFIASLGELTLNLEYDTVARAIDHRLTLADGVGNTIERYSPLNDSEGGTALRELYEAVRRQVLQVDQKLDTLQKALRNL
jgi:hypothetical protein